MNEYSLDFFRNNDLNVYHENMNNLCAPIGLVVIYDNVDMTNNNGIDKNKTIMDNKIDAMFDSLSLKKNKAPKFNVKNKTKKNQK
jgi:hypothetical protein